MTTTRPAVIFDVDGTLCDVRTVRHHVLNQPKDFDAFHTEVAYWPPHQYVVDAARAAVEDDERAVFVCTGRTARWRPSTAAWLREHGVHPTALLMRPDGDYRPDVHVKRDMLDQIRTWGYKVVHAWDDNPAIVALWEAEGIPVTVVPGWDETTGAHR